MELGQLSCCGIFELADIGDDYNWLEPEEVWNPDTQAYEAADKPPRRKAIRACKLQIQDQLDEIEPRGRLVMATTISHMTIPQAALKSLNFRVVRRFRNGNSGSRVTLWMKHVR